MVRIVSIALVVGALVFASAGPSQARSTSGHGFSGGHVAAHAGGHSAFRGQPGFPAHQGFAGHREVRGGGQGRLFVGVTPFVVGPAYPYGWAYDPGYAYSPPVYSAPTPSYWYYCRSAGAYYPDVPSCPEAWIPVP